MDVFKSAPRLDIMNIDGDNLSIGRSGMKGNFYWLDADYELACSHNKMLVGSDERSAYDLLNHLLDLTSSPDEKRQIKIGAEHYYTKFNSGKSKNLNLIGRYNIIAAF